MADTLTRRQMRDEIRADRLLKGTAVQAALDAGLPADTYGGVGDPAPGQPDPSNSQINNAIRDTLSDLNIKARLGGDEAPVSVAIPGQTANGPYRVNLFGTDFFPREGQINEVKRVWWSMPPPNAPLRWTNDRDMDINRIDYQSVPPSIPECCWVTHMGLFILPAPAAPGTLFAYVGKALFGPNSDDEVIPQLPGDLYRVVMDGAAWRLAIARPRDLEMAERAKVYLPLYQDGINDVKMTMGSFTPYNSRLIATPYRVRRGSR